MVIDARTAQKAGFQVGDPVDIVLQDGRQTFTLVGIVGFGETDSLLGATMSGFDLATAQQALGKPGLVDEVDVRAEDGVSASELKSRIAAALPDGVEAVTAEQVADDGTQSVKDAMGIFTTVLLVFAGVALLVGSFVIWNTFNVLVAQRRREVALLRAVGATRRQILGGVLVEAASIGLVSGLLGLLSGVGLAIGIRSLLSLVGVDIPSTSPAIETRTLVVAMVVGLGVTAVAALLPAWSATRVAPMEALRDVVPVSGGGGRIRHIAGWLTMATGAALLLACSVLGNQRWWTVVATLITFTGLVFVGPSLARGLARLADHGRRGGGWRMAARNIGRSSRRAAATALALTIGLTVVIAVAVTASSLKDSVTEAVNGGNRSDLILEPAGAGMGISPSVADLMRDRADLEDVVELREWGAQVGGKGALVTGMDTQGLDNVIDLGIESGEVADLAPGRILVSDTKAGDLGVGTGDNLVVTFPETGPKTFEVVGTFSRGSLINATYVMSMPDFDANVTSRLDGAILMTNAPGVDPDRAKAAIEKALADYPNVTVNTPADITRNARASVDQLLGIVTALLLLAVVVAILGIVNTLALSVVERTRELGLMRAVGATRRQVRAVVRRESVLMSLLGCPHGGGVGRRRRDRPGAGPGRPGHHHGDGARGDAGGLLRDRGGGGGPGRARTRAPGQQGGRPARRHRGVTDAVASRHERRGARPQRRVLLAEVPRARPGHRGDRGARHRRARRRERVGGRLRPGVADASTRPRSTRVSCWRPGTGWCTAVTATPRPRSSTTRWSEGIEELVALAPLHNPPAPRGDPRHPGSVSRPAPGGGLRHRVLRRTCRSRRRPTPWTARWPRPWASGGTAPTASATSTSRARRPGSCGRPAGRAGAGRPPPGQRRVSGGRARRPPARHVDGADAAGGAGDGHPPRRPRRGRAAAPAAARLRRRSARGPAAPPLGAAGAGRPCTTSGTC